MKGSGSSVRASSAGLPVTPVARFPESPFWLDDDPARHLGARLSRAGIGAWATGAGVRDAALGREPFAPRVVEILAACSAPALAAAVGEEPLDGSGSVEVAAGPTRFVLRPLGEGPADGLLAAEALGRDFTANAILCGLDGSDLRDPLGGIGDIAARRVRLAHPTALRDDPVRVIRLARMRILLGEAEPDPEALVEAGIYGADVAASAPIRLLTETVRLLGCGSPEAVDAALRWLDGIGALDGLALLPAPDRPARYLSACARAGVRPDPYLALGSLCAVRVGRAGWIDGLRPRFGDGRDLRAARAAAYLSGKTPPGEEAAAAAVRASVPGPG